MNSIFSIFNEYAPYSYVGAALAVGYLVKRYKDKRKRQKEGGDGDGKSSATPIAPALYKGYMSVAHIGGKTYCGTYNHGGHQALIADGKRHTVPANESIYEISDGGGGAVTLACEEASGQLFQYAGGRVSKALGGGLETFISSAIIKGRRVSVSTSYNNGGIRVHVGADSKQLAGNGWHARQVIEGEGGVMILAFDYNTNTGGWFFSGDLANWSWRPTMPGVRPLRGDRHGSHVMIAGSPYRGSRVPPAQIWRSDGPARAKHVFSASNGHRMFFGIASNGKHLAAGTMTNWRGAGNAELFKSDGSRWWKIWTAPDPEITSVDFAGDTILAATRNERGGGSVYRIIGEPGAGGVPPAAPGVDARTIGGGFRYKPVSEGDHNLVILTPASWPEDQVVTMNGERGRYVGRTNGNRPTYRFSKPGAAYGDNVALVIGGRQYVVRQGGADIR